MAFRIGPPAPPAPPRFTRPPGATVAPPATLWEQLLPVAWRGIVFPIVSMKVTLSQDLVQHKYWGVDSARVEATGRAPMEIEAVIPFVNGIVPGKGEHWGVLYPTVFRDFLKSMADRTSDVLNHPELGPIACHPVSVTFDHEAQRRDGVQVTARWIETIEEDFHLENPLNGDSPIKAADLAALDLDASKDDLLHLVPDAEFSPETFDSLVSKACGFVDSITTSVSLLAAKPGQILSRVQRLKDSVTRARTALTWPVVEAAEKLEEAARHIPKNTYTVYGTGAPSNNTTVTGTGTPSAKKGISLAKHILPVTKTVSRYVTPTDMTVSGILAALPGSKLGDLISLNPSLLAHPEVPAGTVIRYYA